MQSVWRIIWSKQSGVRIIQINFYYIFQPNGAPKSTEASIDNLEEIVSMKLYIYIYLK